MDSVTPRYLERVRQYRPNLSDAAFLFHGTPSRTAAETIRTVGLNRPLHLADRLDTALAYAGAGCVLIFALADVPSYARRGRIGARKACRDRRLYGRTEFVVEPQHGAALLDSCLTDGVPLLSSTVQVFSALGG